MTRLFMCAAAAALLALALFTSLARSDDGAPVNQPCANEANVFAAAARYRHFGHERVMKALDLTPEMMEVLKHTRKLELPKDGMYVNGWDKLSTEDKAYTQRVAFAGWDAADVVIKADGAIDAPTIQAMALVYYETCATLPEPEAAPEPDAKPDKGAFRRVKGQKFACENFAGVAEQMERDFKNTEIRPEHYLNQRELARAVDRCMKAKEPVGPCVVRRCMEQNT